ncbi:hypothetical protein S245_040151, partial [Arachis hypogaea]
EDIEAGTHKPKFQTDLTLPIYLKFIDVTYKVVMKGMTTSEEKDILKGRGKKLLQIYTRCKLFMYSADIAEAKYNYWSTFAPNPFEVVLT